MARPVQAQAPSGGARFYLLGYNSVQLSLYIGVFLATIWSAISTRTVSNAYSFAAPLLRTAQTLAYLEILHSLLKISNSSLPTAMIQVLGRNLVLFGVLAPCPPAYSSPFVFLTFLSWSLAEITRYPLYLSKLFSPTTTTTNNSHENSTSLFSSIITMLRYNAFLLLYPSGILGEIGIVLACLPYIKEHNLFQLAFELDRDRVARALPALVSGTNGANGDVLRVIVFDFSIFCYCGLLSYVYFGPTMYIHMIKQRKKHYASSKTE